MFLGLGGARRRAQAQGNGAQGSAVLVQEFVQAGLQGAGDPLQALATGKYAPRAYQESLMRSKSVCEDALPSAFGGALHQVRGSVSPRSTLPSYVPSQNLSRETSRASGDSGVSVHGEEAISRDCSRFEPAVTRQSQTLALAKKLKNSLGSKFADSLRETIKEVVKREKVDGESDVWPQLLDDMATTAGGYVSRFESGVGDKPWDACWPHVEEIKNGNATAPDHSSLLSFSPGLPTLDEPARAEVSYGGSAKPFNPSSWLSQENDLSIAELSCSPWDASSRAISAMSTAMDSQFFTSAHGSLLGETGAVFKDSGSKEQWMDNMASSRPASSRPAVTRRHFFPEAAAMGTCSSRPDSALRQASKPNFVNKDQSLLDVLKGFQSTGKDCGSFLEFLNPGHPLNQALREDARQRLYGKSTMCVDSVRKASGIDWHGNAYTGGPLEFPESGALGFAGGVKRTRDGVSSVQLSKRQCMGSGSVLLDVPPGIDGVKSEGGFKEYLENLRARESSSYELPGSNLADLLEDLSQDLLAPHASS